MLNNGKIHTKIYKIQLNYLEDVMKKTILTILLTVMLVFAFTGCADQNHQETWRLGDYKGEYTGFRLEDEDSESPKIIIRFEFTNYSNSPISFDDALAPALFQADSELIRIENETVDSAAIPVGPGESYSIDLEYYLINKTDLVEIAITNTVTGERFSAKTHCEK